MSYWNTFVFFGYCVLSVLFMVAALVGFFHVLKTSDPLEICYRLGSCYGLMFGAGRMLDFAKEKETA